MPVLNNSTYKPSLLFKNNHFNTVYRTLFNKNVINFNRKRLELEDGDFIDLDFSSVNSNKVIIAIHGLEGSSYSTYIQSITTYANQKNYDVIAINLRGCSGEQNRLISSYHSGITHDLDAVIRHLEAAYTYDEINIIGYSLGGNISLKYAGEQGASISNKIASVVGISVPCDLKASAEKINTFSNKLYQKMFMQTLKKKAITKTEAFPNSFLSKEKIRAAKSFKDFDDAYTAPVHGFKNAEDYWKKCSCKQFIPSIKVPSILITALDDPFLKAPCYPFKEATASKNLFMEAPNYGGHVGFGTSLNTRNNNWCEDRILSFITEQSNY